MIKNINEEEFENNVLKNPEVVLVDFYASWCPPCIMLGPVLEDVEKDYSYNIMKLNIDSNANLANQYNVSNVPTLLLFKSGEVISRTEGFVSKNEIVNWFNENSVK